MEIIKQSQVGKTKNLDITHSRKWNGNVANGKGQRGYCIKRNRVKERGLGKKEKARRAQGGNEWRGEAN